MRLLLDTHVLLRWLSAQKMQPEAVAALGKLNLPDDLDQQLTHHQFGNPPLRRARPARVIDAVQELGRLPGQFRGIKFGGQLLRRPRQCCGASAVAAGE